ncbi:MAG: NAD(P)H-hydrate dehydratase [Thermomicrobiales bacterium]
MISIITPDTMRAREHVVMDGGVSEAQLIERAAGGIADYLDRTVTASPAREARSVVAVAGPGNNGVDALLAAALLKDRGWDASARLVVREDLSGMTAGGDKISSLDLVDGLSKVDVILDGIFGNSGRTTLPAAASDALDEMRAAVQDFAPLVVAIDCPTGTNTLTGEVADGILRADITLCISNPKIGMLKAPAVEFLGELVVIDIGIDDDDVDPEVNARMVNRGAVRERLKTRSALAHKSQVGGLLIVGGAPNYYGAPRLAGEAALRSGCGYVGLAVPRSIAGAIASAVPELIFHPTSDSDGQRSASTIRKTLAEGHRYQAIVIGPGLGRDEVASNLLSDLLEPEKVEKDKHSPEPIFGIPRRPEVPEKDTEADISSFPLVLDADALNWLSEQPDWPVRLGGRACVLTPHIGEMARLLGTDTDEVADDPWEIARKSAVEWGQVVFLKAPLSCVATPAGDVFIAPRPTPELATPGTGDVLSGLIGAFVAQGYSGEDAAIIAMYVGSLAGRMARFELGTRSVIARDEIHRIPVALRDLDNPAFQRLATS